ncbi:MAG TPA: hypothetical protein VFV50_05065, partial [Bdellovibrionales bacterium]|nr:hypothetical protein [Bdellovibrionales bacterium]
MTYLLALFAVSLSSASAVLPTRLPPGNYEIQKNKYNLELPKELRSEFREDSLSRAKVWRQPQVDIERANLAETEQAADGFKYENEVICKWAPSIKLGGATAKFMCTLPNGDTVKVKYAKKGKANPEIQGEVAASRLFRALGFGADRVYMVRTLRCFGCPSDPWSLTTQMHSHSPQMQRDFYRRYGQQDRNGNYVYEPDYGDWTDFENVAIERRLEGRRIEAKDDQGWSYSELAKLDPRMGASSRAEIDALRLLSSFVQHSDNKRDNQVLVCQDSAFNGSRCQRPFAAPHDLGSTFGSGAGGTGHSKFDVEDWAKTPIWKNGCEALVNTSLTGG